MRMVGVDVGGTFTDAVLYDDERGELRWAKAASTPDNPAAGVLAAIDRGGVALDAVDRFVHGVTIGTNAILERKGAPVWLVTTRGFGDTLEIARTNRTTLYDIKTLKPAPLVPRARVIEVDERLMADGSVRRALDRDQVEAVARRLADEAPAALVVAFLHAYVNDAHEAAAAGILRARLPGWFICTSSEVLPEMREYERFNTAVLNATIGPVIARYLDDLSGRLRGRGYGGAVQLMISSGGIVNAERAARFPVRTVLSGPAGGVAAATHLGRVLGLRHLITYDMGGTSTDVCLVDDLAATVTSDQFVDHYPIRTPQIEINTVGAGGGSIAWVDAGDIIKVGPQSAGAAPGPACYGQGGAEPTVTDANLVLGRLSPEIRLAGSVTLDIDLARTAVGGLADAIAGLDVESAADGIVRIAVARMVSAIKEISIVRGHDPRDFVLVAYGGAGPMHAAFVAEELEVGHVVVPPSPGNFSAFGALISNIRHDHVRTHMAELDAVDGYDLERRLSAIEAEARAAMAADGMAAERISTTRALGMRYVGQSWDLHVPLSESARAVGDIAGLFHAAHERRFGYRTDDPVEVVSLRVSAFGRVDKPKLPDGPAGSTVEAARKTARGAYDRDRLPVGARIAGPATIEEMGAVTVLPAGWAAEVGRYGELHLRRGDP